MIILGIETSCDETAISLIEYKKPLFGQPKIEILANELISQIKIHEPYGGVFPMLAKREHSHNLIPLLLKILEKVETMPVPKDSHKILDSLKSNFVKDTDLFENLKQNLDKLVKPKNLDAIAVTRGPGLEPCLWTGLNFAQVLGKLWNIPVIPVNHMEGHILVSLLQANKEIFNNQFSISNSEKLHAIRQLADYQLQAISFPALALLISGGHTELVLIKNWHEYEIVGQTLDDAVGEAFDKVARVLGLSYPGGPQISSLAEKDRSQQLPQADRDTIGGARQADNFRLPRPMLKSKDLNFSFSGLKTAVLYLAKELGTLSEVQKQQIAREFEDSIVEVLTTKTRKAVDQFKIKSLILGGGVVANKEIRKAFEILAKDNGLELFLPQIDHSTDNAIMIALAGALQATRSGLVNKAGPTENLTASGNLKLY